MKAQSNSIVYSSFFDILECGLLNKSNYSLTCNTMALSLYNKLIENFHFFLYFRMGLKIKSMIDQTSTQKAREIIIWLTSTVTVGCSWVLAGCGLGNVDVSLLIISSVGTFLDSSFCWIIKGKSYQSHSIQHVRNL